MDLATLVGILTALVGALGIKEIWSIVKKKLDHQLATTKHLIEQIAWSWEDDSPVAVFDQCGYLLNGYMEGGE